MSIPKPPRLAIQQLGTTADTVDKPAPTDADIDLRNGGTPMCRHQPHCPAADASDRDAARIVSSHPEQGWNLLCNGVVSFDDTGDLLPDGSIIAPRKPLPCETESHTHSAA
jgi:hypothetical protein